MKTKKRGWEEDHRILTISIKDCQQIITVDQRQELKIWENCVAELYDRAKRPENLEIETEEAVDTDQKTWVLHSALGNGYQGGEG